MLTEAVEHVKRMLRSMRSDFSSPDKGEGNTDIHIPTQADTDAWKRQQEENYRRKYEQWVIERKKYTLPRLKKEISDAFLRHGRCKLLLPYSSTYEECLCAVENWEDLSSWATRQGVVLWLSDDKYNNLRLGRYRILTGKRMED